MRDLTLKFFIDSGIISLGEIVGLGQEATVKTIIDRVHKFKITQGRGKDKRYVTSVPDETKPRGTRQVRTNTITEMYGFLIDFYGVTDSNDDLTFGELFGKWIEYKRQFIGKKNRGLSESTICRYQKDYSNYIANTPLANEQISNLNKINLQGYLIDIVIKNNDRTISGEPVAMLENCAKNVIGYVSQCLEYACDADYVPKQIKIDKTLILSHCHVPDEEKGRVLKRSEFSAYIIAVRIHEEKHPGYMPDYIIELAILTGMRVGELVALHWSDIDDAYIHVNYSEHRLDYVDRPSEIVIGEPKNRKHRLIPLTDAMRNLFDRVRALNRGGDFVFVDENGDRIRADPVTSASRRRAHEAGLEKCSIHCIRRTVSSMLNETLPRQAVASMLGHLPTTNERYYDYDIHEDSEKVVALDTLSAFVSSTNGKNIV